MEETEFDEKFQKLKFLFEKGILTAEQYEKKKEELVDLFVMGGAAAEKGSNKEKENNKDNNNNKDLEKKKKEKGGKIASTSQKQKGGKKKKNADEVNDDGVINTPREDCEEKEENNQLEEREQELPVLEEQEKVVPQEPEENSSSQNQKDRDSLEKLQSSQDLPEKASATQNQENDQLPETKETSNENQESEKPQDEQNEVQVDQNTDEPVIEFMSDGVTVYGKPIKHMVLFPYTPGAHDELELVVGETVEVTAIFDDGWMKGHNDVGEGVFPANYVEIVKVVKPDIVRVERTEEELNEMLEGLCAAVWEGNTALTKSLARELTPESINKFRNSRGQSIVYCACRQGHYQIVRYFLGLGGIDFDSPQESKGSTPLHGACFGGSVPTVALLLSSGLKPDVKNSFGNTAFDEKNALIDNVVKAYKENSVVGVIPFLNSWSGYITTVLHSGTNWPSSENSKTIFEIVVRLYSYDGSLLTSFNSKGISQSFSLVLEREFKMLVGGIKTNTITAKFEVFYAKSKNQPLRKWAIGEASFDGNKSGSKKINVELKQSPTAGSISPRNNPTETFINVTFTFTEIDEEAMKDEVSLYTEKMGMKLFQFQKFHDTMRQLIESYKKNQSTSPQVQHIGSSKHQKEMKLKSFLSKDKNAPLKNAQPTSGVKIQLDMSLFKEVFEKLPWGTKYNILQHMPDFHAEYLVAKSCKAIRDNTSFNDFMQDNIISNKDWFDAYLVGECVWLPSEESRKVEENPFRYF